MRTAAYWHATQDGGIQCDLCPHACVIADGATGLCRVRTVEDGALKAAGYGLLSSLGMDPIEKKPLYHFRPGSRILSLGGWGCTFRCSFCQNWSISQQCILNSDRIEPEMVVRKVLSSECEAIAYTYNEPIAGFEFVSDCASLAREKGLANVLVTNGFINREPAAEILPLVDALNIDIKSMDERFYARQCHGRLNPVLDFAVQAVQAGCHVEITNLIIPGLNDDEEMVRKMADWICFNLGEGAPLHLSAYRPMYKMSVPATTVDSLDRCYDICAEKLNYVYLGNVDGAKGHDTVCPGCGAVLIRRSGYVTDVSGISGSACAGCGRAADIVISN